DCAAIAFLDTDIERDVAAQGRGRVRDAVHRGDHIVRSEVRTVVEFHALAQGEAPIFVVDELPFGGKRRLNLEIGTVADQSLVNMVQKSEIGGRGNRIRIKGVDVHAAAPTQWRSTCR